MTHTVRRYALKYGGETNYNYVALDDRSGGYPYATGLANAQMWAVEAEARDYLRMFPEFTLVEVEITAKTI